MLIFASLLIPCFVALVLWLFFKHKTVWWEFLIPFVAALIISLISKATVEWGKTSDTEYWSGVIVRAEYYEKWDEWIEKTCTETYACGTDSKGNTEYCTRSYDCSYVDYHSAYWQVVDNNGFELSITEAEYKRLVSKFGGEQFVELNRDYYHNDGDEYRVAWDGSDVKLETVVTEHNYENRVQASDNVFNYLEVDTTDIKKYKLYEYPELSCFNKQVNLLGRIEGWKKYDHQLEVLNGRLGAKKHVKAFMLLYEGVSREAGLKQEAYWKGGNDNEIVICIGMNKGTVTWCHVFSWSPAKVVGVTIRDYVEGFKGDTMDLGKAIDKSYLEIDKGFKRRDFKEFDYIDIEPSNSQVIWTFVITLIVNLGLSIWLVNNEFSDEEPYSGPYYDSNGNIFKKW